MIAVLKDDLQRAYLTLWKLAQRPGVRCSNLPVQHLGQPYPRSTQSNALVRVTICRPCSRKEHQGVFEKLARHLFRDTASINAIE